MAEERTRQLGKAFGQLSRVEGVVAVESAWPMVARGGRLRKIFDRQSQRFAIAKTTAVDRR